MKEWSNGAMEYWSIDKDTRENPAAWALSFLCPITPSLQNSGTLVFQYSITPVLQHSNQVVYVEL